MSRPPLYSPSPRARQAAAPGAAPQKAQADTPLHTGPGAPAAKDGRLRPVTLWTLAAAALCLMTLLALLVPRLTLRSITQDDIDRAVRASLERHPLPSAADAYELIAPSVVRVAQVGEDNDTDEDPERQAMERGLGTGVVIVDDGTILTNLHVVWGARKLRVRFFDGHESEAVLVGAQPENDLAVLRALSLPDDLQPATMRSTADLRTGDPVIAVGHPFGIGPSTSAGVVSGLNREFRSPEGEKTLTRLIQFDAAANPGNSGGPLVTLDGHVVGIVTAILNPTDQHTFIGIGFAVPIENAARAAGMPPF